MCCVGRLNPASTAAVSIQNRYKIEFFLPLGRRIILICRVGLLSFSYLCRCSLLNVIGIGAVRCGVVVVCTSQEKRRSFSLLARRLCCHYVMSLPAATVRTVLYKAKREGERWREGGLVTFRCLLLFLFPLSFSLAVRSTVSASSALCSLIPGLIVLHQHVIISPSTTTTTSRHPLLLLLLLLFNKKKR